MTKKKPMGAINICHHSIHFNVNSEFNGWWGNQYWQEQFNYQAIYGTDTEGLDINFKLI